MPNLSEVALVLLRIYIEREGNVGVDESNRDAHRELEKAGLVILSRPFTGPPRYILTKMGWKLKEIMARMDASVPSL